MAANLGPELYDASFKVVTPRAGRRRGPEQNLTGEIEAAKWQRSPNETINNMTDTLNLRGPGYDSGA